MKKRYNIQRKKFIVWKEDENEESEVFDTIEKIKEKLNELNLTICKENYFMKKAEIELNKVLKREEK